MMGLGLAMTAGTGWIASAIVALVAASSPASLGRSDSIAGFWRNPDDTVVVRISPCGENLCGTVVRAAPQAIADSAEAGYPALIGMRLMHDYRPARPGHWLGTVFVPDLGRSFSSKIDLIDSDHARIAGCLWRQHFCKSQVWQRLHWS
jgi:uncharacterized protein (DUF2147 family)